MTPPEVIVRLAGGLGNQLFQYAFGRALAVRNGVPLRLDAISGFPRDRYRRSFALAPYNIECGYVPPARSYATPVGRIRRRLLSMYSRCLPIGRGPHVVEAIHGRWNPAISNLRVERSTYFIGHWQHEEYFREIRDLLLRELTLSREPSDACCALADRIPERRGVAVHVRCLRHVLPGAVATPRLGIDAGYYERGINFIAERIANPMFFVFSDAPEWARKNIACRHRCEFLEGGRSDQEDLWLMSRCRGFVIANSTFSWWGAWLSQSASPCVVAPLSGIQRGLESVPAQWQLL